MMARQRDRNRERERERERRQERERQQQRERKQALTLRGARVVLRGKRMEDAEKDYIWRSDAEIARLDATQPMTMKYERFLKNFEGQLRTPTPGSHHFGIETDGGKYIGNCMYYDLNSISKEAEVGIVIGDKDYWSGGYGYDAVITLLAHMFEGMELERVFLHTLEWNHRARKCFERSGFRAVGKVRRMSYDFIRMEVTRGDWHDRAAERVERRRRMVAADG